MLGSCLSLILTNPIPLRLKGPKKPAVILALAVVLVRAPAFSQTESLRFEKVGTEFSTTLGVGMTQDCFGFLWVIDWSRLFSFDGYSFIRQHTRGHDSFFSNDWVMDEISGGRHGVLCLRPRKNELCFYDIRQDVCRLVSLVQPNENSTAEISCAVEDTAGRFWVGCFDGRLFRISPPHFRVDRILPSPAGRRFGAPASIRTIAQDSSGTIWIGSDTDLRQIGNPTGDTVSASATMIEGLPRGGVAGILGGRDGRLWIAMENGRFGWIRPGELWFREISPLPSPPRPLHLRSLAEDRNGNLWVVTMFRGLYRWSARRDSWDTHFAYPDAQGRTHFDILLDAMVDMSGVLWVMTSSQGLMKHLPATEPFRSFTAGNELGVNLYSDDVSCAWLDTNRTLWVGSETSALSFLENGAKTFGRYVHNPGNPRGLNSNFVVCLLERRNGELWVGTVNGGINIVHHRSKTVTHLRHDAKDSESLGADTVTVMYEDRRGSVWVGHYRGIDRFDPSTAKFTHVIRWPSETLGLLGSAASMLEDSKGVLWIGTAGRGLLRMNLLSGDTAWYRHDWTDTTSFPSDEVSALFEDSRGRIWAGTSGGLGLFDESLNRFRVFGRRGFFELAPKDPINPLPRFEFQEQVALCGIAADHNGNLWLLRNNGSVLRFDVKRRSFQSFGLAEGVIVRAGRRGAFFRSRDGIIYCGGPGGITWFNPDSVSLAENPVVAPVAITQFRVGQTIRPLPRGSSGAVALDYSENTFTFTFAILDFRNPEGNRYRYMLEGVQTDWVTAGHERTVTYAGIQPGEYRFRVRGSAMGKPFGPAEASMIIVVGRPYWQTWWFRGLLAAALAGLLYGVYRYRLLRLLEVQRLRLRIADDLHDDIGSELSSIALQSDLIAREFPPDIPQHTRLSNVGPTIRKAAENLRDVVWIINPELDRIPDLVARMRAIAGKMLTGLRYTIESSGTPKEYSLDIEFKRHVLMTFKEMLNNVVRHAGATYVQIEIEMEARRFRVSVRDDGRGFDTSGRFEGRGLYSLRARAEAIGGTLTLESCPGKGTTVCLQADFIRSGD